MNHLEYRHLVAEKTALDDTISKLSPGASNALRSPLELRRRRILDRLEGREGVLPEPEVGVVAVAGGLAVGSGRIGMELAGEVLLHFGRTVSALSRHEAAPVLTGLVPGSFGFRIEPGESREDHDGRASATAAAFDKVIGAMVAVSSGNDESVAAAFADFNPSAVAGFRRLMSTLAENEIVCSVEMGANVFRFSDPARIREVASLMESRVEEVEEEWTGRFQGFLPDRMWGEFVPSDDGGSVAVRLAFEDEEGPDDLNDLTGRPVRLRVQRRRVGRSRPRFTVLALERVADSEWLG